MMNENLKAISALASAKGWKAYLVGGGVRDALMDRVAKDNDVLVVGANPEALAEALKAVAAKVDAVGKSFGVIKATFADGEVVDVAVPRTERSTGPGHKDFQVSYEGVSLVDDLRRRDFTFNAMARDLETGELIDPFGGFNDIGLGLIRTVNDNAFVEDPLRVLRAFRFRSRYGFSFSTNTMVALRDAIKLLPAISPDRIGEELRKILAGSFAYDAMVSMSYTGALATIIPEWKASEGFRQNNPHHYATVDNHVLDALSFVVEHYGSPTARLAVLLHDIAKPYTYSEKDGKGHFYGHEDVGASMAADILRRLRVPEAEVKSIATIIREHLRPPLDPSEKALRKYIAALGDDWEDAIMVKAGDLSAHNLPSGFDAGVWHSNITTRLNNMRHFAGFDQKRLAVSGNDIASLLGVSGKDVGDMKKRAVKAIIEGRLVNERGPILRFLGLKLLADDAPVDNRS